MSNGPKTLQDAFLFFAEISNCIAYMVNARWPDGIVVCPTCERRDVSWLANQKKWQCKSRHAKRQFSAKVGTIFEDSPLGLEKWLPAVWIICNSKNGVSSCELARTLGVTQETAWFMLHRIRLAMQNGSLMKLGGKGGAEIGADETFIGGKARNMHVSVKARRITGTGTKDKIAVMGLLERGGEVRTVVVSSRKKLVLQAEVRNTSKRVRLSTLTSCSPMKDSPASTPMPLWITPLSMSTDASTPIGWRTFGVCSSAPERNLRER